ncbi:conserved exported hypothetical protein [Crenothrix polyspora]|uniref:DUF2490 domain-containing protein n=1 Tax=Crenothrix polyspora TaxID=360316 RepID=A0A1R4HJY5_9GAMM|nr:DUF2490 domain-containing protein [Crenothrix polyspora]SJM96210.1 conserved exported hypothetical protein [Crenothrix polyspora]
MMKKILALCLGLAVSGVSLADDDTSIWISNTYQTDFGGSKYLAFLELQPRFNKDDTKFNQLIIRPFFGYKITKNLQASLGFAWQGEYNSKDKFDLATKDLVEQVQWIDNLTPQLNFQYRFRLEQRFFADADLSHRMRHRFRFQYSIPESKLFLVAFDELFIYLNSVNSGRLEYSVQSGINQNRSYFGVGYKVTPNVNIDTGYQLQYVNNFGKEDLYNHVWLTNLNINF